MSMREQAERYLELRRSLGCAMTGSGRMVTDFATMLDARLPRQSHREWSHDRRPVLLALCGENAGSRISESIDYSLSAEGRLA
jgi:hypothetical protein